MSNWVHDYYRNVDAMDMDAFIASHADDISVTFGNNPPAQGKDQVRESIGQLWSMLNGLRHDFRNVWQPEPDLAVLEAKVTYSLKDGRDITLPVTSILTRKDQGVDNLRIYIDMAPVFS
tara:strand:- start:303 stop:659 length:357 start_codon:yes stop_codon:yes gene_type:complete